MSSHNQDAIDRKALRIANVGRPLSQRIRFLGTMNPQAQERYRLLASHSLKELAA